MRRIFRGVALLAGSALLWAGAGAGTAVAAESPSPGCGFSSLYVVAHADDSLLFQSPAILRDIESRRCVRSVFLTAGDDGRAQAYWGSREEGVEASYAQMAGVANEWSSSTVVANGHSLLLRTLSAEPRLSLVFMRLPDGGYPGGTGSALYGYQSLMKLWNGGNKGSPSASSITAVDKSNTYGYQDLIGTLAALTTAFGPQLIATQDFTETFSGGDHRDHVAGAYFAQAAHKLYKAPHQLFAYEDYDTPYRPQNVFDELLEAKSSAFYTYGLYDDGACAEAVTCASTEYVNWLKRQYVVEFEAVGVLANAGYAQTVDPQAIVSLDGSESSDESGNPLAYRWTQTGGPTVSLSGAQTAKPSFQAPAGAGTLTFSLTVLDGITSSAADTVTVTVDGGDPTPIAAAGAPQVAASGATVKLDGSASFDPNGEPLQYSWTQTAGPGVSLSAAATAKPSFVAPTGPASLTFSLVVSTGSETSAPSTVTVDVSAPSGTTDVSSLATASASSEAAGQTAAKAIDGVISGYPVNPFAEWSSNGGKAGSWLSLKWSNGYLLDHVVLYDRPNPDDQIKAGTLTFSDGSTVSFGALPNDGATGLSVSFPPRATTSLKVTASTVSSTTLNVGLSEVQAWGAATTAPAITSAVASSFTTGTSGSFTVATTGSPTATLKSSGTLPSGVSFVDNGNGTATLSGTPAASAAPAGSSKTYALTLTATSGAGTATQNFTLTVVNNEPKPVAPAFTSAKTASFTTGTSGSFTVATTGSPTATLKSSGTLPSGVSFVANANGTATLSGTPAASAAPAGSSKTYALTLTATNSAGSATQSFTLTVVNNEPKPSKPVFTTSANQTGKVGTALKITIEATGVPTPTLSLSGSAPKGLTFTATAPGKATLSGTPTTAQTSNLSIVAKNSTGSTTQTLRLVVSR